MCFQRGMSRKGSVWVDHGSHGDRHERDATLRAGATQGVSAGYGGRSSSSPSTRATHTSRRCSSALAMQSSSGATRVNQRLLCRAPQPLPQLPPALLICRERARCQGQEEETLPATAGHDAPGEAGLAARHRLLPQARRHPGPTPDRGHTTDRQRGRPATQRSKTAAVSIHPPSTQMRRLLGGIDLGDDHADRPDIQGLLDPDLLRRGDPQHGFGAPPDRLQEPQRPLASDRPMLGVDEQPIETDLG